MQGAVHMHWARFAKSTLTPLVIAWIETHVNSSCSSWRYKNLLGYFYELFPFLPKLLLKTIMFLDDTDSVPKNDHCIRSIFVQYESSKWSIHTCIHVSYVRHSHQFATELQSNNGYTYPVSYGWYTVVFTKVVHAQQYKSTCNNVAWVVIVWPYLVRLLLEGKRIHEYMCLWKWSVIIAVNFPI